MKEEASGADEHEIEEHEPTISEEDLSVYVAQSSSSSSSFSFASVKNLLGRLFTKENAVNQFHKNKYVMIFCVIFAGGLLALGFTAWKGAFPDPFKAWMTVVIIFLTFLGLIRGIATPELLMMANTFA